MLTFLNRLWSYQADVGWRISNTNKLTSVGKSQILSNRYLPLSLLASDLIEVEASCFLLVSLITPPKPELSNFVNGAIFSSKLLKAFEQNSVAICSAMRMVTRLHLASNWFPNQKRSTCS